MAIRRKPPNAQSAQAPTVRFEATLGAAPHAKAVAAAAALDLDRLPDVNGKVNLLVTPEDARRLLEQGFEVHLMAAVPVAPLAPNLVMSDTEAKNWLEQQVKGVRRKGAR
jgi:hypothetical protein